MSNSPVIKPRPLKSFVSGHDFSRAANAPKWTRALAPAGMLIRIVCIAFLAGPSQILPAQETTLHVDVKLVSVFVNVTDRNGAIVGGLSRENFALSEDGHPQQIAVFEKQSEMPLNLMLAIDTSGSVRKDLSEEAAAARRFAHAILRQQDRMSEIGRASCRERVCNGV